MRIIIIGFGVVGQNFVKMLGERHPFLLREFGINPRVVAIADSKGAASHPEGLDLERLLECKAEKGSVACYPRVGHRGLSPLELIEDVEADVVAELSSTNIQTGEPALSHIQAALKTGKHVVTTNKGPLVVAYSLLSELAKYNRVYLRFSGTVGGGTPLLSYARKCLEGDQILSIRGILNGTTNYILTRMEEGLEFSKALREAQVKGYAEADPTLDIDGIDAAAKLVIMANSVLRKNVSLKDVDFKGIRQVSSKEISSLLKKSSTIRLIASAEGRLEVRPTVISLNDPLYVKGALNAVTFRSKYAGEQTVIGRGAGGIETASAVLRDLIDIKENILLR